MSVRFAKDLRDLPTLFRAFLFLAPMAWLSVFAASVVAVVATLLAFAVVELTLRRVIPVAVASPLFWIGGACIAPFRAFEGRSGYPEVDPAFALFLCAVAVAGLVGSIAATNFLARRGQWIAAVAALLVIPVAWRIWIFVSITLSEW